MTRGAPAMRVLIDAVLGRTHPRGIGRYVSEIARHGQQSGEATFAVAIAPWHRDLFAPLADVGVELVGVRAGTRGARIAWHAFGAARLARRLNADVLHVPDRLPVLATAGRPMVATVHDTAEVDLPDAFGAMQLRYRRWVLFDQLRRATRVITPSLFSARRITGVSPAAASKTVVIGHGPGLDPGQPEHAPHELPAEHFMLFVGAVQRHKSAPLLVRAFRSLGLHDTSLVIAGTTHNDEAALAAATEGDHRIVRLSAVADAELAWLYRRAALLAMPSRYEGFCIPILEAMQFGCPVIAADAGAMPEIAGDAAMLVPPSDELAWADALARLLTDDSLRTELSAAGRARAASFSWQRAAADTIATYRAALATAR